MLNKGWHSRSPSNEGESPRECTEETWAREASLQNGGALASFGNHADQALKRHLRELQARKCGTLAGTSAASGGSKCARRTDGKWRKT